MDLLTFFLNVKEFLGYKLPITHIINAFAFSTAFYFYILTIGSFLKITVYPLLDRITYSTLFVDKYFIDRNTDSIILMLSTSLWFLFAFQGKIKFIFFSVYVFLFALFVFYDNHVTDVFALFSFPIILIIIIFHKYVKNVLFINKSIYLRYILLFSIVLASISLFISIMKISFPNIELPSINFLYYINLLLANLSPFLIITVVGGTIFILIRNLWHRDKSKSKEKSNINWVETYAKHDTSKGRSVVYLISLLFLSILIVSIPHLHTINSDNQLVADDSKDYGIMLERIKKAENIQEMSNVINTLFNGDRLLSILIFYPFSYIIDPTNLAQSIDFLPVLLSPILVLTIYLLTFQITSNRSISLISSFLTITTFQVLVGTYAGFFANWLSLIFVYLAIFFLIRAFDNHCRSDIIIFSILMTLVLVSHEPTWPILFLLILIFLILWIYYNPTERRMSFFSLSGLIPSGIIEMYKVFSTKSSGLVRNISFASINETGIQNLSTIWHNLVNTSHFYLGGLFGNSIIFLLVIYWLKTTTVQIEKSALLLLVFLSLLILPVVFGNEVIQTRVLYEIPFQIPAAIAMFNLRVQYGKIIVFAICFYLLVFAIRSVSNFNYSPI